MTILWRIATLLALALPGCWRGDAVVGDPCEEKQECQSRLCLQESRYGSLTGWRDGYCTKGCDGLCPDSDVCAKFEVGSYCLSPCDSARDCRPGYLCHPLLRGCLPDCREGFDCLGNSCTSDGLCSVTIHDTASESDTTAQGTDSDDENDTSSLGEIGAACTQSAQCSSGLCMPEQPTSEGIAWQDGSCTQACGDCPAGSICATAGPSRLCLPQCGSDSDCRDGYVCDFNVAACLPDCRVGFPCPLNTMCSGRGSCSGQGGGFP
ncbi:MAG: hypothetical protein MUC50_01745 [Myxococcota bacterium]|nr:hypothetical protein [Myxococcota bacterium]